MQKIMDLLKLYKNNCYCTRQLRLHVFILIYTFYSRDIKTISAVSKALLQSCRKLIRHYMNRSCPYEKKVERISLYLFTYIFKHRITILQTLNVQLKKKKKLSETFKVRFKILSFVLRSKHYVFLYQFNV